MIYEWKCTACGEVQEVKRAVADYLVPPTDKQSRDCKRHNWKRIITKAPGVPWNDLRDSGMFMDEHGNYAPRKLD